METEENAILVALRNFFLARTGEDLSNAYVALSNSKGIDPDMDNMGWEEVEYVFNKLFVGPMSLEAPPYASCYLAPEPQLMTETTLQVRRIYGLAGLISPLQGRLPDDHLGVELDAALGMLTMIGRVDTQEPRALWQYFFHEHLEVWLPQFLKRARNADAGHPVVDLALDLLDAWLTDQEAKQEGYNQ